MACVNKIREQHCVVAQIIEQGHHCVAGHSAVLQLHGAPIDFSLGPPSLLILTWLLASLSGSLPTHLHQDVVGQFESFEIVCRCEWYMSVMEWY
jgi:hypothetical protein